MKNVLPETSQGWHIAWEVVQPSQKPNRVPIHLDGLWWGNSRTVSRQTGKPWSPHGQRLRGTLKRQVWPPIRFWIYNNYAMQDHFAKQISSCFDAKEQGQSMVGHASSSTGFPTSYSGLLWSMLITGDSSQLSSKWNLYFSTTEWEPWVKNKLAGMATNYPSPLIEAFIDELIVLLVRQIMA